MLDRLKQSKFFGQADGFTVLEILIVVVILGILSQVIIPRMTRATSYDDQQERALAGSLITLRSQMELYRVEHLDEFPCGEAANPVACDVMVQRLTGKTNTDHSLNGIFGPYLTQFPYNPFNGLNDVRYGKNPGQGEAGWCFDPMTGQIWADDKQMGADGTAHSEL